MNVVHIAPTSPYNEGWGYQENLLLKYQSRLVDNVTLIVANKKHVDGLIVDTEIEDYYSQDGFRVIRRACKKSNIERFEDIFFYLPVQDLLEELMPDYIFLHGFIGTTIFQIAKYKRKHKNVVIVQDNHLDYNIGFNPNKSISAKAACLFYRSFHIINEKYINKVYGVTPWRKEYAEKVFGVSAKKSDVLIMGADDEKIDFKNKNRIRSIIREKYDILPSDFLIVTGGKIDKNKKIDILMQACSNLKNVKLLIFGNLMDDIKEEFQRLLDNSDIIYIGWINSNDVYNYYFAADLVFFPGQHSVLWEQACASKVPCVFSKWPGMEHVNNGGNSDFVTPINIETVSVKIKELCFTPKYYQMKRVAESEATDIYLYSKIAEESLECVKKC